MFNKSEKKSLLLNINREELKNVISRSIVEYNQNEGLKSDTLNRVSSETFFPRQSSKKPGAERKVKDKSFLEPFFNVISKHAHGLNLLNQDYYGKVAFHKKHTSGVRTKVCIVRAYDDSVGFVLSLESGDIYNFYIEGDSSLSQSNANISSSKQEIRSFFVGGLNSVLSTQKDDEPVFLTKFKFGNDLDIMNARLIKRIVAGLKNKLQSHPHFADGKLDALDKLHDDIVSLVSTEAFNRVETRFHSAEKGKSIVTLPSIGVKIYVTLKLNDMCSIYVTEYETSN